MKIAIRSISAQLLTLLVLAMLAAHAIAVFTLNWWRTDDKSIHPLSIRTIESRVVAAYRLASSVSDVDASITAIDLPESQFRIVTHFEARGPAMSSQETSIATKLQERLLLDDPSAVFVRLQAGDAANGQPRASLSNGEPSAVSARTSAPVAWWLVVDLKLPDGRWLQSRQAATLMPPHWNRVLSFSLLVGMIPTALIAIMFGHRIMRPLKRLTEASRYVSRGERIVLDASNGPTEVREITAAFNEMQESLSRYVNGRTQMIAAIGHDLRTPLTSLRIRAELVDNDALREAMVKTLDEMSVIVEETLNFARGETMQESPQDIVINDLLRDAIETQKEYGRTVQLVSSLNDELIYRCRPVSLKRAINNLVDNASRYGAVQIGASISNEARALHIEIHDNGPGIPPEEVERLFEPFSRLDRSRSQGSGGLGLGLAIARSCVRSHGGDVNLINRHTGGLTALIQLPL